MKYINRALEKIVKKTIGNFPVIAITGPRQVGKTTLLEYLSQNMYEKVNYVSLDDLLLRSQANEDPELFLRTHETPLIIDEFQYVPKLLNYIKIKVDEMRKNTLFKNQDSKTLYFLLHSNNTLFTIPLCSITFDSANLIPFSFALSRYFNNSKSCLLFQSLNPRFPSL